MASVSVTGISDTSGTIIPVGTVGTLVASSIDILIKIKIIA